jgi:hypothetical protein
VDLEKDQVYLNFDGWTSRYDYWTEFDHEDLMPCGWFAYVQDKQFPLPFERFDRFDPPKGVDRRSFTWEGYLESKESYAVPFELFSEVGIFEYCWVELCFIIQISFFCSDSKIFNTKIVLVFYFLIL